MVDDHAVVQVVDAAATKSDAEAELRRAVTSEAGSLADVGRDVELLARSLRAYGSYGLAPKPTKSVRFEEGQTDLWGATMHGTEGWVRAKLSVLWRAILVTLELRRLRRASLALFNGERLWRLLFSLWSHALSLRRPAYAFLQEVYAFVERFASEADVRRIL